MGGLPSEHIIIKGTESDVGRHRYMPVDNAVDLWSILEGEEITLADDEISAPEGDLKPAQEAVVDSALEVTGMVTGSVPSNFSQSANETTLVR